MPPLVVIAQPMPERGKTNSLAGYVVADSGYRDLEIVVRLIPKR